MTCEYLPEFSKKFETAQLRYLGAWGKLIYEKNLKSKISLDSPFKRPQELSKIIDLNKHLIL
jgi:hypothetical protein